MRIEPAISEAFTIYDAPKLDPITVVLQDLSPGRGRIIIECYGSAWATYFGAIGDQRIRDFLVACSADYVVGRMWSFSTRTTKHHKSHLLKIVEAVLEALKNGPIPAQGKV